MTEAVTSTVTPGPARRPLRARFWIYRPEAYLGFYTDRTLSLLARLRRALIPVGTGGDEWDWHTVVLGWTFTGRVVFATRRCTGTGKCADYAREFGLQPDWPADPYPEESEIQ